MFSFSRLGKNDIFIDLETGDFKTTVFQMIKKSNFPRKKEAFGAIIARENLGTTAIGNNVAIPHCRLKKFRDFYVKVAIFRKNLGYITPNADEIRFVFMVIGPDEDPGYYLRTLSHISRVMNYPDARRELLNARNRTHARSILCKYGNKYQEELADSWKRVSF